MKKRDVSVIIFYDGNKRILLQDRCEISKYGEEWGFFGGGIESGETPEEAVVRETKEELDYDLKDFSFFRKFHYLNHEFDVNLYVFTARLPFKKFIVKEGKRGKLFSLEEAKKLKIMPWDYLIIDALKEII